MEDDMADLWNCETPITDLGIDVPKWIEQDISPSDVAAILQGGCESGAYMPAATYHQANATMGEHGDAVLDFIQDSLGELPTAPQDTSWIGIAVFYLSCAVEIWASNISDELETVLDEVAA
jgi:hypothetical protein